MNIEKLILIKPRGFCFGVRKAINIVEDAISRENANKDNPIYIKHEIVHNKHITKRLEEKGALTKESLDIIPDNSTVVFSAHGSLVEEYEKAKEKNLKVIDATCPLVEKVHERARKYADDGYKIIYIGKKGHKEALGVVSEAPENIFLIQDVSDIEELNFDENDKLAVLTQTTLNVHKTRGLIEELKTKFTNLETEKKEDICFATTNRQEAVEKVSKEVDLMIIVGSKNSSNTKRLFNISKENSRFAFMVDDLSEIDEKWFDDEEVKTAGISSGASVPDDLVMAIVEWFKERGVEVLE